MTVVITPLFKKRLKKEIIQKSSEHNKANKKNEYWTNEKMKKDLKIIDETIKQLT